MEQIKIKNDGKHLLATMPNGDVIPGQLDMVIKNENCNAKMTEVIVTIRVFIPTEEFYITALSNEK